MTKLTQFLISPFQKKKGVYDGSEITEAVSVIIHLSQVGVDTHFFAPNVKQYHVINHLDGTEQKEERNVLVESARITRGNIQPLEKLKAEEFDGVVFPVNMPFL